MEGTQQTLVHKNLKSSWTHVTASWSGASTVLQELLSMALDTPIWASVILPESCLLFHKKQPMSAVVSVLVLLWAQRHLLILYCFCLFQSKIQLLLKTEKKSVFMNLTEFPSLDKNCTESLGQSSLFLLLHEDGQGHILQSLDVLLFKNDVLKAEDSGDPGDTILNLSEIFKRLQSHSSGFIFLKVTRFDLSLEIL